MLEKNEMKLAMLNSAGTNATATAASVTGAKDLPLKLIRPCCRLSNFVDDETSERNRLNCLVEKLEKRLSSDNRSDSVEINRLVENAIHWCLVNGFVLVPKDRKMDEKLIVTYLPFTLFPSLLDRAFYNQVCQLQPHINGLIHKLASSPKILEKAFENLIVIDDFLKSLWSIYQKSITSGAQQKISLSVLRTDYMLHDCGEQTARMKQVEVNTIAAGFGYVGTRACQLHDEILKWFGVYDEVEHMRVKENNPLAKIAQGFVVAWHLYRKQSAVMSPKPIVVFVVLDYEINIADQRHLEYEICRQEAQIEVVRCTLRDLNEFGYLDEAKTFFYKGREVAIAYYRAGYDPSHYKSQNEWNALLKLEISKVIKCPTLGTFLAGMKKIQEFISHEENLFELCNQNFEIAQSLKSTFVNFFKLDTKENIDKVYENSQDYVLKPQREGGGNNLYNLQIKEFLSQVIEEEKNKSEDDRDSAVPNKNLFIVMDLIKPVYTENYIISPKSQQMLASSQQKLSKTQITNELGIYGVLVRNGDEVIMNETAGYCLRSKPSSENESGVMCGSGALDSLLLVG